MTLPTLGRLRHIPVGTAHKNRKVTLIKAGPDVRIHRAWRAHASADAGPPTLNAMHQADRRPEGLTQSSAKTPLLTWPNCAKTLDVPNGLETNRKPELLTADHVMVA